MIDNLINDGVSDQVSFIVKDANGKVKTPFKLHGVLYRPDENGEVRIADEGRVETIRRIKAFKRERVDNIMNMVMDGDDIASYIFGVSPATWES